MKKVQRTCPVCDSATKPNPTKFQRDGWTVSSCPGCNFHFLAEAPDYSELSENLTFAKLFTKEATRRKKHNPALHFLDHKTRWRLRLKGNEWDIISQKISSGNVLDIGCGAMNKIPSNFKPFGIEVAKDAAELADQLMRKSGGRAVHAPALEGLNQFADEFFDGIIMRSYLEHELSPKKVLRLCYDKLKIGGVVYIKVPNFECLSRRIRRTEWCGFRFPDHVNYFDAASLQKLAVGLGYRFELKNKISRLTNDNIHCFITRTQ